MSQLDMSTISSILAQFPTKEFKLQIGQVESIGVVTFQRIPDYVKDPSEVIMMPTLEFGSVSYTVGQNTEPPYLAECGVHAKVQYRGILNQSYNLVFSFQGNEIPIGLPSNQTSKRQYYRLMLAPSPLNNIYQVFFPTMILEMTPTEAKINALEVGKCAN